MKFSEKNVELEENLNWNSVKKSLSDPFVPILKDEMNKAICIMKDRLPRSANGYNMALMAVRIPESKIRSYSVNGEISDKSVFIFVHIRQDWGQDITISIPVDFKETNEVRRAFSTTKAINWKKTFTFAAVDSLIAPIIHSVSPMDNQKDTMNRVCSFFYMSAEDAANLEIEEKPGVVVTSLDTEAGLQFIVDGWKYKREGSQDYTREVAEHGVSAAVYVDGIPAAAVILNFNGVFGMLYSGIEYRGKGYAKTCLLYVMKQMGLKGYAVASAAECHNVAAIKFHESVGFVRSHSAENMFFTTPTETAD